MRNNKVVKSPKQQSFLAEDFRLQVPVLLAEAILDIVDWLCTEDRDVEELVNNVKPKAEVVLRSFKS